MKLRTAILVFFVIAGLLGSVLGGLQISNVLQGLLAEATGDRLRSVADSRADHINTFFLEQEQALSLLAASPVFIELLSVDINSEAYPRLLDGALTSIDSAVAAHSGFLGICLRDRSGRIAAGGKGGCGFSLGMHNEYAAGKRGIYTGEVFLTRGNSHSFSMASPVLRKGEFLGTVSIELSTGRLVEITSDITGLGETGEIYLINGEGSLATPSRFNAQVDLTRTVDTDNSRACLELLSRGMETLGETPVFVFRDYRGVSVMGTYVSLPKQGLCVMSEIDEAEALIAPAEGLFRAAVLAGITIVALFVLMGIVFADRLSKSISGLTAKVDLISKGDLGASLGKSRIEEVQKLIDSLDRILASLKLAMIKTGLSKEDLELGQVLRAKKEAEIELQRFKKMADNSNYGLAMTDLEGKITYINKDFAKSHGYAPEELLGEALAIFHSEEQLPRAKELLEKIKAEGGFTAEEIWHKKRDGTVFPMLMNGVLIRDEGGSPAFMAASAVDITERKAAAKMVEESEEKYREIFELSPEAVVVTDVKGNILDLNGRILEWVGYGREDLLGMSIFEVPFLPAGSKAEIAKKLAQRMLGKEVKPYEIEAITKSGERKVGELRGATIRDETGKIIGDLVVVVDITEKKKAEAALLESEECSRKILESTVEGFWRIDNKGITLSANKALAGMLGYSAKELLGRPVTDFMPKEEIPAFKVLFARRKKRIGKIHEFRFRKKDGTEVILQISTNPLIKHGKFVGAFAFVRDITPEIPKNS